MDNFDKALAFTLKWEGGYWNDPADPGGPTNFGVTQRVYDAYRLGQKQAAQSVKLIQRGEVDDIYRTRYWLAARCDQLTPLTGLVLFDCAVNHGVSRALAFLAAAKASFAQPAEETDIETARRLIDLRVNFYYAIVKRRPTSKKFLKGWLNRARSLKKLIGY